MALSLDRVPKVKPPKVRSKKAQSLMPWQLPDAGFIDPKGNGVVETSDMAFEVLDPADWQVQVFHLLQDAAAATLSTTAISETLKGFLADWAKGSYTLSKVIRRGSFWTQLRANGPWRLPVPSIFVTEHHIEDSQRP